MGSPLSSLGPNPSSFSPSQMAGDVPTQDPDQLGGTGGTDDPGAQANALQAVTEQFMQMEQQMQAIASQFPVAAPEVRTALASIKDVLKRIVSSPGADQEPPAPRSLA